MTTAESPRLPTSVGELTAFMPPQPQSAVSQLQAALARLDQAATALRNLLADRERQDNTAINELVDVAQADGDLAALVTGFTPADRNLLQYRLDLVDRARNIVHARLNTAQLGADPIHAQWREQCRQVEADWREAMSDPGQGIVQRDVDQDGERLKRLIRFAERHTPR